MSSESLGWNLFARSEGYAPSEKQLHNLATFSYASVIPGSAICFLVLISYAAIGFCSGKTPRQHLDRVSFRLLCCALFSNVLFGISWGATPNKPGITCNINSFFTNVFLLYATFLTSCIALNLQLVLVHELNGAHLEKWYRAGTTILVLVINIPPFVLGQFGWDLKAGTCWYGNPDPNQRLRWYLSTQFVWIALSLVIELSCSIVVFIWLYRSQRSIAKLKRGISVIPPSLARTPSPPNDLANGSSTEAIGDTLIPCCTEPEHDAALDWGRDELRTVVIRIALYPMISVLMNLSTVLLDLHVGLTGISSRSDFNLLALDLAMYALRPFAYGLLAVFDPSFLNAVKACRRRRQAKARGPPLSAPLNRRRAASHSTTIVGSRDGSTADLEEGTLTRGICVNGCDKNVRSIARQI